MPPRRVAKSLAGSVHGSANRGYVGQVGRDLGEADRIIGADVDRAVPGTEVEPGRLSRIDGHGVPQHRGIKAVWQPGPRWGPALARIVGAPHPRLAPWWDPLAVGGQRKHEDSLRAMRMNNDREPEVRRQAVGDGHPAG